MVAAGWRRMEAVSQLFVMLLALIQSHAFVHNPLVGFHGRSGRVFQNPRASVSFDLGRSSSAPTTTTTDEEFLNQSLRSLNIQPPWKKPDSTTRSFHYVLNRIQDSQRQDAGVRAEAVLRYMLTHSKEREALKPDCVTLNKVLAAFAKSCSNKQISKKLQIAENALTVFTEWQELYRQGQVEVDVDRLSYNTVMTAFAKAGQPERAKQVFDSLQRKFEETDNPAYQPDAVSRGAVLHALSVAGKGDEALILFRQMIQQEEDEEACLHWYNYVLYAFANSQRADEAEIFLEKWESDTEASARPDSRSYNIALHALAQTSNKFTVDRAEKLLRRMPTRDCISYTTVIGAHCRLGGGVSIEAVDSLVDEAFEEGLADSAFVSNVLYSLATVDRANVRIYAERLVLEMKNRGVPLDLTAYNALIYCWAKASDKAAGRRVVEILALLEKDKRYRPDVRTYTSVIDALKGRGPEAVSAAEDILSRMEMQGPAPNTHTYTALIQVYARSRLPFKANKASELLQRMKTSKTVEPNVVSYNAVLNACEFTNPNDREVTEAALRVACLTFDEIKGAPFSANHVTYGSFLGVLRNLVPTSARQQIVALVFRRCCQEGQVSNLVVQRLKAAVESSEEFESLLQGNKPDKIPRKWNRNVRESKARNQA